MIVGRRGIDEGDLEQFKTLHSTANFRTDSGDVEQFKTLHSSANFRTDSGDVEQFKTLHSFSKANGNTRLKGEASGRVVQPWDIHNLNTLSV